MSLTQEYQGTSWGDALWQHGGHRNKIFTPEKMIVLMNFIEL